MIGEKNQNIQLVSKGSSDTILPKGAYLTVENENRKLRVEKEAMRWYNTQSENQ